MNQGATEQDYSHIIAERAQVVFDEMSKRESAENMKRIHQAFEFAMEAHANQKRKTGEPYILHPIAVAGIVAVNLKMGVNPVMAAFLHDVVEDTEHTIEEITERFGADVAGLVKVLTKQKKDKYVTSKQFDNFRQMLESVRYDIRALLVKLADRLHNMRTLSSMRPEKQMKIAGETDYFFAPLANRLGLYNVKTELENLSMRFRCPHEFDELVRLTELYKTKNGKRIEEFRQSLQILLEQSGIKADVEVTFRNPYSLRRMMQKKNEDFWHLPHIYNIDVTFDSPLPGLSDKIMALRIYSILTDRYREKPGSIVNYIDSPKENGYRSFHVKLLSDFGQWQEVHIASCKMREQSQLGIISSAERGEASSWVDKFRNVLNDMTEEGDVRNMVEAVVETFYNDDIMTFTPSGKPVVLPKNSSVIDFAFEVSHNLGWHAKYARINGQLSSIKTQLKRGDVVEVFTAPENHPCDDWEPHIRSLKARKALANWQESQTCSLTCRCSECKPLPGEDVIGYRLGRGFVQIHKRDCPEAIRLASRHGDDICSVEYEPSDHIYPVTISIRAIDRHHLMIDLLDSITNKLNLSMSHLETERVDSIVTSTITFGVHSFQELQSVINHIQNIDSVDEVREVV